MAKFISEQPIAEINENANEKYVAPNYHVNSSGKDIDSIVRAFKTVSSNKEENLLNETEDNELDADFIKKFIKLIGYLKS